MGLQRLIELSTMSNGSTGRMSEDKAKEEQERSLQDEVACLYSRMRVKPAWRIDFTGVG